VEGRDSLFLDKKEKLELENSLGALAEGRSIVRWWKVETLSLLEEKEKLDDRLCGGGRSA